MKVLILNSILYTSESKSINKIESIKDCMIYNVALGFKELGHEVTLVAAKEYEPIVKETYDIDVIFIKSNLKSIFQANVLPLQLRLFSFLLKKKKEFDLILSSEVFSFPSLFSGVIAPKKTIIWHELAIHPKKFHSLPSILWYNIIYRLFYRKVLVVPRSEFAKKFISQYAKNISDECVEHGINLHKFKYSSEKKEQFIIVSQLIARKNIGSIINIFDKFIKKYNSNFKLIVVGKGESEKGLKELVAKLELTKQVIFVGFKKHEELNELISESMGMLVNTKQDNNMVSIAESIVSGTPVMTNLIPTNAKTINDYTLGMAKDNWNEDDLYQFVLNNIEYVNNCVKYRENLSTTTTASTFIAIYTKYNRTTTNRDHASSK